MKHLYSCPAIRRRLTEFLGGEDLESATAAYVTRCDGVPFDARELVPPVELDCCLEHDLDVARSLADVESYLVHLDVEYVNFDSPAEAYLDPWRAYELQEPLVRVIESVLLRWNIRPLHLMTGRGHHFVWRIRRSSAIAQRLLDLAPAPELVPGCVARVPPLLVGSVDAQAQQVFSAIALVIEFLAHRIKELAAPRCAVPVEITAVHVGPGATRRREMLSIDISEYGDPLHTRMIRMPFSRYLKPWASGMACALRLEAEIPFFFCIPMHEMDFRHAIKVRQVEKEVCELAGRACVRIPMEEHGMTCLLDHYIASRLRCFHEYFYSARHDPRADWPRTYDSTPLDTLLPCVRHLLDHPNDLLLKPAGMQLVTRTLMAVGWHPRHIAGLLRSKFENPAFGWGVSWSDYDPAIRADFYTRLFAGLLYTGLDGLVDYNCTSTQEKGFCFPPPGGTCSMAPPYHALLSMLPKL